MCTFSRYFFLLNIRFSTISLGISSFLLPFSGFLATGFLGGGGASFYEGYSEKLNFVPPIGISSGLLVTVTWARGLMAPS